jgi:ribokinase
MAVLEVPIDTIEQAFQIARSKSIETILNAAPPTHLSEYTLSLVDHLIVNETEAESICGIEVQDLDTAFDAAHAMRRSVRHSAIVTLGEHGAVLCGDTNLHVKAFQVQAVDSTAAGDAFCGAFAFARSQGDDLATAVHQASGAGALATTIAGAQPSLPTAATLNEFLA